MQRILSSATKLVLLWVVFILGVLSLFAGIVSVLQGTFSEAAKVILASFGGTLTIVIGFYFGSLMKGQPDDVNTPMPTATPDDSRGAGI